MVVRQRPPTARGLVFLSVSDETGMANVVLGPVVYERDRAIVRGEAHFTVIHNSSRPFVVRAASVEIRDIGTALAAGMAAGIF